MTTPAAPAPTPPSPRSGRLVLGGLLVLFGVGWFLETVSDVEVPWSVLLPSILILVGLALIAGARSARRQPGMVTFGIVLTVMLALGSGFDVTFGGGIGQRVEDPATVAQLEREYELGVGDLTVDLTEALRDAAGRRELSAHVGIGQLTVVVPEGVGVRVDGKAGIGQVTVFDEQQGGLGVEATFTSEDYDAASSGLDLELEVGIGQVVVRSG